MGPPLPRTPYVSQPAPIGPMVGPQRRPGRDYAVLDWGAGSGSEYDLGGGVPAYETK